MLPIADRMPVLFERWTRKNSAEQWNNKKLRKAFPELKTIEQLRHAALRWLARRDYSHYELEQKFQRKNVDPALIENAMTVLVHEGWINDERFTENFIYSRRSHGYGPERIQLELLNRGIAETIIHANLNLKDPTWQETAQKLWEKYFQHPPKTPQDWLKQARFLSNRGYSEECIESLIKKPL